MGHVIDGVRCLHYYSSILVIHGQILQQTVITISFHKAPWFSPELVIPFYLLAQFLFSYHGVISKPGHRRIRLFSKTFRYVYVALDRSPPDMLRSTVLGLVLAVDGFGFSLALTLLFLCPRFVSLLEKCTR